MKSMVMRLNAIQLPQILGEWSMIPFDLETFDGLPDQFKQIAKDLLKHIPGVKGIAHFTFHCQQLRAGESHRRGGPHVDGNYDREILDWNGNGWKVGENGPRVDSQEHKRLYVTSNGGIVMASNHSACNGWVGEFPGIPGVGGDCSHLDLGEPNCRLDPNVVYYGNNHFIHESCLMNADVTRALARITLPAHHEYIDCTH